MIMKPQRTQRKQGRPVKDMALSLPLTVAVCLCTANRLGLVGKPATVYPDGSRVDRVGRADML